MNTTRINTARIRPFTLLCHLVLVALCLASGLAHAQTVTGSITGQVTDSNGIQDSNFGVISSVRNQERRLQLSLNYKF